MVFLSCRRQFARRIPKGVKMAVPDIVNNFYPDIATDTSHDSVWFFRESRERLQDKITQLSLKYYTMQAAREIDQTSIDLNSIAEQTATFVRELYDSKFLIDDYLIDYDHHTEPLEVKTLVGKFKQAGKGKTIFHFDVE
jgi:hypothetical protein